MRDETQMHRMRRLQNDELLGFQFGLEEESIKQQLLLQFFPESESIPEETSTQSLPESNQAATEEIAVDPTTESLLKWIIRKEKPISVREIQQAKLSALKGLSADKIRLLLMEAEKMGFGSFDDDVFTLGD
ncbi:hypothetical protein IQ268_30570 [Oculatella sp. LEGE 06141]|uniref:hypothetical protein n=2 Tax=Oculatella sp. LEGE 06141 TaxID=1828648 RepID=UPI00187F40DF|nr:hypothetical protein [Oculatella sp. LEGE 06141]MBE9182883.1 hypothetical protein [Oculatella sp. LEGE 06141]